MALAGSRRIADSILDSVVVSFAAGALAYYSTRLFSTSAVMLVGIWIALVIAIRLLIRKFADDGFYGEPVGGNHVTIDTSVPRVNSLARNASWAGLIAAVLAWLFISKKLPFMSSSEWALIILIFVGIGSVVAIRQASKPVGVAPTYSNFHWIPWVIASGMGLVASATLRPQSDDTNYLNISTWIAERGTLPTKDTIFSDQVFSTKPLGSAWEPLWGALAHATHIAAPTLLYVIAVPILTMLSVFALDRGLRAIHDRHTSFALLAASLFLLLDGKNIFSFGVFHGSRIWQGKSFFVSAMIPLLISAGVLWARNGRRNDLIRLILIATAAAGMTTTATMLVPIMLAVFAAVVGYQRGVKSAGLTLTGLAMPLYIGLTFRKPPDDDSAMGAYNSTLAAIHPATLFNSLGTLPDANEFLRWMSKPALHAALFALVMCWGWLGAESRTARRVIAGLSLSWAIVYLPPVLGSIEAFTGVSAISWRFWWLIPIPMLVGSATSAVVTGLVRLTKTNRMRFAVSTLALAMLVSCIVIPGKTVWTSSLGQLNGQSARLAWPPGWKVFGGYYDAKLILDEIALDGDIVAARSNIEKSLAATTVRVHPVLPKISWYSQAGGAEAKASLPDRLQIRQFTSTQPDPQLPELNLIDLPNALDRVGVNVICLDADRKTDIDLAKSWGYVGGAQVVKLGSGRGQWCARKTKN